MKKNKLEKSSNVQPRQNNSITPRALEKHQTTRKRTDGLTGNKLHQSTSTPLWRRHLQAARRLKQATMIATRKHASVIVNKNQSARDYNDTEPPSPQGDSNAGVTYWGGKTKTAALTF